MSEQEQMTTYYYVDGRRTPLFVEPNVFAVRFKAGAHADSAELSSSSRRLVRDDSTHVGFIPNYGIQIFELESTEDASAPGENKQTAGHALRAVRELNDEEPVAFATPALRQAPDSPDLMFATNRFLAQFKPEVTRQQIDELNARHQVRVVEPLDYAPNGYLLEALETADVTDGLTLANAYFESGLTIFSHPDFIKRRHWRRLSSVFYEGLEGRSDEDERSADAGSYLGQQWHLARAKVIDAWGVTKGSPEIRIAILDDGVDLTHPEVSQKVVKQFDFASNVEDANPKSSTDRHGTACAGVAAAAGVKAFGAAPACSLIAVRTPEYLGVADEAKMFKWAADNGADVISCSWGPRDGTGHQDPLPEPTRAAIHYCIEKGRGGKGIPICWAAGNGNESVSLDGYASNAEVIAVAALTSKGVKAWYSDYGKEVWICAPSSGDKNAGEQSIFTIDRRGAEGYNAGTASKGDAAGDYTNTFGGTSAAAPLVAGIVGLILSANPELRWDQVKEILKQTAEKVAGDYDAAGHSNVFGYGCIDALAAVRAAKNPAAIPNKPQQPVTPTIPSPQQPQPPFIEGPSKYSPAGAPPTFKVEAGPNRFYAVEVATRPELFARSKFGTARNSTNFYASWYELPFLSAATYTLPLGAWRQLKAARRLYYRLCTTASRNQWINFKVTVSDDNFQRAPYIELTGEPAPLVSSISSPSGAIFNSMKNGEARMAASREVSDAGERKDALPWMTGPLTYDAGGDPPTFALELGKNRFYAVEVAVEASLFDRDANGNRRTPNNFYASWRERLQEAQSSSTTYTLSASAWNRLRSADRLYYRLLTTSAQRSDWPDYQTSTPDDKAEEAPSIELIKSGARRGVEGSAVNIAGQGKLEDESLWNS